MRQILRDLGLFARTHVRPGYALFLACFYAASIAVNYTFDIEASMVRRWYGTAWLTAAYVLFYGLPLTVSVVSYALWYNRRELLHSRPLLAVCAWAVLVLSLNGSVWFHQEPVRLLAPGPLQYWLVRCLNNLVSFVVYVTLIGAWWAAVDRRQMPLYGLRSEGFRARPFLLLLLMLLPAIAVASSQPDFLQKYPRYTDPTAAAYLGVPQAVPVLAFELCYGIDFLSTEFFFRGFMMLAIGRVLGPAAIFPMVSLYLYLHFEKPLAEALSSVIGGAVLGAIAWRTRSILAGVLLHLGVAWMMEAAAWARILAR